MSSIGSERPPGPSLPRLGQSQAASGAFVPLSADVRDARCGGCVRGSARIPVAPLPPPLRLLCGVSTPRPHVNPSLPSPPLRRGGTPCRITPTRMSRTRLPVDGSLSHCAARVTRARWGFFCDSCGVRGQGSGGCHRRPSAASGSGCARGPALPYSFLRGGVPGPGAPAPGFVRCPVRPPAPPGAVGHA